MKLSIFQIDAFADQLFAGNPAAVVPLQKWLDDSLMQKIAAENNLSETAFFVASGERYYIRWFTPAAEVKLCGHATLASAYVLFNELGYAREKIVFDCLSGELIVSRSESMLTLNFPAYPPQFCEVTTLLTEALGCEPSECYKTDDLVAVFETEKQVRELQPDFALLKQLNFRGIVVTAPATDSRDCDFVARFFAPKMGISEDPVTGSAYTKLTPLWADKLDKTHFVARQLSQRGGVLQCELQGDRVLISGRAVKYLQGEIQV